MFDESEDSWRLFFRKLKARGTQQVDAGGRSAFLALAEGLELGIAAREKIGITDVELG